MCAASLSPGRVRATQTLTCATHIMPGGHAISVGRPIVERVYVHYNMRISPHACVCVVVAVIAAATLLNICSLRPPPQSGENGVYMLLWYGNGGESNEPFICASTGSACMCFYDNDVIQL